MNKYQIYSLLGRILALDTVPAHREDIIQTIQKVRIPWEKMMAMADHHLILQALYPKIQDHSLQEHFPEEFLNHLKNIFDLNTSRNLEIINQSERISKVLVNERIKPLFMKGVGNILDGVYTYPGERILHDIDILVSKEKFEDAAEILIKDGYRSNYSYKPRPKSPGKHYPILYKPGEPIYVELHLMPSSHRYDKYFNTDIILKAGRVPPDYLNCLVMSDEHKIIHNFIHAQLDHGARFYGWEFIRNLYDLLLLSRRQDPESVFSEFGHFKRTSSGYLDITYDTFGITPNQRQTPRLFLHTYRFRYYLNLRYWLVRMTSKLVAQIIIFSKLLFLGFIVRPVQAINNKAIRIRLLNHISNPQWYRKQIWNYMNIFGFQRKKS